jgi:hypothetical protein
VCGHQLCSRTPSAHQCLGWLASALDLSTGMSV